MKIEDPKAAQLISLGLKKISDLLSRQSGKVAPKRLQVIRTTLNQIQQALKKSIASKADEIKGSILDVMAADSLKQEIAQTLGKAGLSVERLESWQSWLSWAFGEETGEFADFFIEQIRSIVPPKTIPQVPSSKKKEAPPPSSLKKGWLSDMLTGFYIELVWKAVDAAQLSYLMYNTYSNRLNLLNSSTILYYLPIFLPQSVHDWFYRVQAAILRSLGYLAFRLVFSHLIDDKTRTLLESYQKTYKGKMEDLQMTLEGKEQLSFQLPAPLPVLSSLPLPDSASNSLSLSVLVSTESSVDIVDTPTKPEWAEDQVVPAIPLQKVSKEIHKPKEGVFDTEYLEFTNKVEEVNPQNVEKWLKAKISQANLIHRDAEFDFLISKVQQLAMAAHQPDSFWQKVENPDVCHELISELSTRLFETFEFNKNNGSRKVQYPKMVICSYKLLAIQDQLARRSLSLGSLPVDATPLLRWIKTIDAVADDPLYSSQLLPLLAYFFPDFTLRDVHQLNDYAIYDLEKNSYFSYRRCKGMRKKALAKDMQAVKAAFQKGEESKDTSFRFWDSHLLPDPERDYLRTLLTEPRIQAFLNDSPVDTSTDDKVLFLFQESFFTKGSTFLGPSLGFLRTQTLLSRKLIMDGLNFHVEPINTFSIDPTHPPLTEPLRYMRSLAPLLIPFGKKQNLL